MTEKEMEDLLWDYPDKFFAEPMSRFRRQTGSAVGEPGLIFIRSCQLLVVEVTQGALGREGISQLRDHRGVVEREFPDPPVALMAVANSVPPESRVSCQDHNVDCREIPEQKFRDVAQDVGYVFESEVGEQVPSAPSVPAEPSVSSPAKVPEDHPAAREAWEALGYKKALATVDECFEIVREIDDSLGPVLRESGDKKARRRFVILGRGGSPICPSGTQADDQPLRFELWKEGSIKVSGPGGLREAWVYTLAGAGLPVSRRKDRTVITPLGFKDVREQRQGFMEFFEACLKWWQAAAR